MSIYMESSLHADTSRQHQYRACFSLACRRSCNVASARLWHPSPTSSTRHPRTLSLQCAPLSRSPGSNGQPPAACGAPPTVCESDAAHVPRQSYSSHILIGPSVCFLLIPLAITGVVKLEAFPGLSPSSATPVPHTISGTLVPCCSLTLPLCVIFLLPHQRYHFISLTAPASAVCRQYELYTTADGVCTVVPLCCGLGCCS